MPENATAMPTIDRAGALAKQLSGWADDGIPAVAHMRTGRTITADTWFYNESDGVLAYEGDGGVLTVLNPEAIELVHFEATGYNPFGRH